MVRFGVASAGRELGAGRPAPASDGFVGLEGPPPRRPACADSVRCSGSPSDHIAAHGRLGFEEQEPLDEAYSDRVMLFNRAVQRMLLAPAPDVAALAAKIAVAVDEQAWELPRGEAGMARIRADAALLAGPG